MANVDYGIDVLALDDLTDPEVLVSGNLNVAYAMARRWMTPTGALAVIGDPGPYDSIDVREWFGARINVNDRSVLDDLQTQAAQVLIGDPRVASATVRVTYAAGVLRLEAQGEGAAGPFRFVLAVDGVSTTLLQGG